MAHTIIEKQEHSFVHLLSIHGGFGIEMKELNNWNLKTHKAWNI